MTDKHGQAPNENEENKEPEAQTPESDNVEELLTPEKQIEALQTELLQAKDRTMRR